MVWAAFCSVDKLQLRFTTSKMNSAEYIEVLNASLDPFCRRFHRIPLIFQQDNASIHKSKETMAWLGRQKINVLDWPARSPDLNPIENLWGIIVRRIYAENRQFQTVDALKSAIQAAWTSIDRQMIQNLVNSMQNRIFQVINRSGKCTDY